MMILEYSANSALAELRAAASSPASAGHTVLSRGLEEAASFASQAARQALRAAGAYRLVLACELVAAVRARDPDWAECVMRSHLYSARAALLGGPAAARPTIRHAEEDSA